MRLAIYFLIQVLFISSSFATYNSLYGPSGLISIPTSEKVRNQEENINFWYSLAGKDNYGAISTSLSLGKRYEFSAFSDLDSKTRPGTSPILSLKYSFDQKLSFGYMHDTKNTHRDIAYAVFGNPEHGVFAGTGLTLGNENLAVLGNYSTNTGKISRAFFMAGARMELSEIITGLEGIMEFNGETTNFGLTYKPANFIEFGLSYFNKSYFYKDDHFVLSTNLKF